MPHHSSADLETIFDADLGEGYEATITDGGTPYTANVIISRDFEQRDELNGIVEKVVVLEFLTASLEGQLSRGATVTADGSTWTVEKLIDQDTYVSRYSVS